jgi:hypothetical protein
MVLDAAFDITRRQGIEFCNARSIGAKLDCSTHPLFRVYSNMEELKNELSQKVVSYFYQYLQEYPFFESKFLTFGLAYLDFAKHERNLFKAIMASGSIHLKSLAEFAIPKEQSFVAEGIMQSYNISGDRINEIFLNGWFYINGLASMIVSGIVELKRDEVIKLLRKTIEMFRQ